MILGVIAYAIAVEEAMAHPGDPLPPQGRLALAAGLVLFLGFTGLSVWRAAGGLLVLRLLVTLGTGAALVALAGIDPAVSMAIALAGVLAVVLLERWPAPTTPGG